MLTVGFIESLYFACDVAESSNSQDILNRIGNQKSSLTNLVNLLRDVNKDNNDDLVADLVESLTKLENEFNKINITYTYQPPKHVPDKNVTYITSTSNVDMSDESMKNIIQIVTEIRAEIID